MATNPQAAASLLGLMLAGISIGRPSVNEDAPDLSLDQITEEDGTVTTTVVLATGDRYRVTVEWLSEESP